MALLELIEILPVVKSTVKKSLFSDFRDFEYGLQQFRENLLANKNTY
jgi:hypothetical protein